jgi:hypothetical protein
MEFYNSQLYGAINCLNHISMSPGYNSHEEWFDEVKEKEDEEDEEFHRMKQYTVDESESKNIHSGGKTFMYTQSPTATATATATGATTTSQTMFPVKKLGPVLLELRYLHPVLSSLDKSWHLQSQTIALSRGISSLGTNVSSTCLSFRGSSSSSVGSGNRQPFQVQNPQQNLHVEMLQVATGLTTGALCIHTLRNLHNYIPSSSSLQQQDFSNLSILDSNQSEDASISYFSHYHPRQNRHASTVAWRPGNANANFVAIGLVGSGIGGGGGVASVVGVGAATGGVVGSGSGNPSVVGMDTYRSVPTSARGGLGGSSAVTTSGSEYHSAAGGSVGGGAAGAYAPSKDRDYCALIWDIEASSKGVKQSE